MMHESQDPAYGRYQGYQQQYDGPPVQNPPPVGAMYDDAFVDSFAQRLSQRMAQGPQGKLNAQPGSGRRESPSAGMRLALAIVSVVMLVPLSALSLGIAHNFIWLGLIALGILTFAVIAINLAFNNS